MKVTVAICTWNRARLLERTLTELQSLQIPDGVQWELLVVDNQCTDSTGDVIRQHENRLPLKWLFESEQGQSHARNCAIDAAEGELLIWTDDDVLVDPHWLAAYVAAAKKWPEAGFFGGVIEPWFESPPPRWLQVVWSQVETAYAARDFGAQEFAFDLKRVPFGANFAVRTAVQRSQRYDPSLGRIGSGMVGGDDTHLLRSLLAAGWEGRWVPKARVRHFIPKDRQSVRYLRRYYHGMGLLRGREAPPTNGRHMFGCPRWLWRRAIEEELRYRFQRAFQRPEIWIEGLRQASRTWGEVSASREWIERAPLPIAADT